MSEKFKYSEFADYNAEVKHVMGYDESGACCDESGCCNLVSLVSVDERGQLVLPKELRDKMELKGGDKLAIMTCEKEGKVCCITMVKADELADSIKKKFGPLITELFK